MKQTERTVDFCLLAQDTPNPPCEAQRPLVPKWGSSVSKYRWLVASWVSLLHHTKGQGPGPHFCPGAWHCAGHFSFRPQVPPCQFRVQAQANAVPDVPTTAKN